MVTSIQRCMFVSILKLLYMITVIRAFAKVEGRMKDTINSPMEWFRSDQHSSWHQVRFSQRPHSNSFSAPGLQQ